MTAASVETREPDFLWMGKPVYRCRVCRDRFERVKNLAAVLEHEREKHPAPELVARESAILAADGQPYVVLEGVK